ncbi:AraC family transcriptional regulator [Pedobacter sp. SD-b]|uniref:AraC family transcriptional regulator n=1 Tax=Pedobacter segetis TaxID=2793069 RepID=A0ABS1BJV8_9SPHI|nr:helix-turn-helix domain-containing protein [Pedobacter segetis]MBK0383147.1 AraC family transcriptional regulator [Pedobacter segetis]
MIIALNIILINLQTAENKYIYASLLGWAFPFPLLHWPFLYLYVSALTSKKGFSLKLIWLHFVPFFLTIVLFSNFLFLSENSKIHVYEIEGKGYETELIIHLISILLSAVIYTTLSIIKLLRYKNQIMDEFSYLEKINLNWLSYLIGGMTIIFLAVLFVGNDKIIYSLVVGFVFIIGYYGIGQVGIFTGHIPHSILENNKNLITTKYNLATSTFKDSLPLSDRDLEAKGLKYLKSTLNQEAALRIYNDLNQIMLTKKLYKNVELKLDDLAEALNVLPNHLSQVINSIENKNFYDYINQLRIDDFIKLISLPENQKFTLLSLAFECGFNSKTSFNRNFKKVIGVSPSEYVKQRGLKTAIQK